LSDAANEGFMSVTIDDVAKAAGVSNKTVSRVLNKEKYVAAATRAKVDAAVAALGFRPSFAARALAGRKSFQIALLTDNPSPYYAQNIQAGVRARCQELGYRMIAQPVDSGAADLLEEILGLIDQAQLDGVILTPPLTENGAVRHALSDRGLPFVMTAPARLDPTIASAFIDNAQAAQDMTRYLIEAGHKRIGFVAGDPRYAASARRKEGYEAALREAGLAFDPELVQTGHYTFASGSEAAEKLLALQSPPTAIFASSDDMAAGVLATAHRLGIKVPSALSVAGFDDTDLAAVVWPPLTTIRQPVRDLGFAAADLLLAPNSSVEQRLLPHTLIIRGSVAKR
jgi:LacI family transcriptional regulator